MTKTIEEEARKVGRRKVLNLLNISRNQPFQPYHKLSYMFVSIYTLLLQTPGRIITINLKWWLERQAGILNRLQDGAKSNARKGNAHKAVAGIGRRVLATGDVLLALLVDEIADTDEHIDVELRALVKETKTCGTRPVANQVTESTREDTAGDRVGVTSIGRPVAARELSPVTTLGLSLLDGHVVRNGEADARPGDLFAISLTLATRGHIGESNYGGCEG